MKTIHQKNTFCVLEDRIRPDLNKIIELLDPDHNEFPVYIVRDYLSRQSCDELKIEFYNRIDESHGGNRHDFVPVLQIGATQFTKPTSEYFKECEVTSGHIHKMLAAISDDYQREDFLLEKTLKEAFAERDVYFGPSSYYDKTVNSFSARRWMNSNDKKFLLLPHEDLSQLNLAKRDNYEIADVKKVIACNLCVSNNIGGDLILWDCVPDLSLKVELGVEDSGYPYPISMLKNADQITIQINPGDLYFINANLVHAVREIEGNERITLGRFIGHCAKDKVVYWT